MFIILKITTFTQLWIFLEGEHVKNIFEWWILIIFLLFFSSTIDDNTHMDEWVYPIIVEIIYHDEVKDFLVWKNQTTKRHWIWNTRVKI